MSAKLNTAYRLLDALGWLVPAAIAVVYYGTLYILKLPARFYIDGIFVVVPVVLFLRTLVWATRYTLMGEDVSVVESIEGSLKGFLGNRFTLFLKTTNLDEASSKLGTNVGKVMRAVTPFVPGIEQYFKGQFLIRGQDAFIATFRNALQEYGIEIKGKAAESLKEFHDSSDAPDRWVAKASLGLSEVLGVPAVIFRFMYADYTEVDPDKKNLWKEIVGTKATFRRFVSLLLASGKIPGDYKEKSLEAYGGIETLVVNENPFGLKSFARAYSIQYYEYASEKDSLIEAIKTYHIGLPLTAENEIKRIVPPSFGEKERLRFLIHTASTRAGTSREILWLLYYEKQFLSDKRKVAWADIKGNKRDEADRPSTQDPAGSTQRASLQSELVTKLVDGGHITLPSNYPKQDALGYAVTALNGSEDFTLSSGVSTIIEAFSTLGDEKDTLIRTLSRFNIRLDEGDRRSFLALLPQGERFKELVEALVPFSKVPPRIIYLFYYDFTAQVNKRDTYFDDNKTGNDGEAFRNDLAGVLIQRKLVHSTRSETGASNVLTTDLAGYLSFAQEFNLASIDSVFSNYVQLHEESKEALRFMANQGICHLDATFQFDELIKLIPEPSDDFLEDFRKVIESFLKRFGAPPAFPDDWLPSISFALVAVFLVQRENVFMAGLACSRAAAKPRAVKILYEYSWTNEEDQFKPESERRKLVTVITEAIGGSNPRTEYLPEFERALSGEYLYKRISDIPNTRLRQMEEQVKSVAVQLDFKKKLDEHLKALGTFLDSQLKSRTIMESLRMQLVTVYQINVPTGAPVLGQVVDEYLPKVCQELAQDDESYKNLFIAEEAKEHPTGRWTRLGVVPFRMSFNDFARNLRSAYMKAWDRYKESGATIKHEEAEFVANVIRIFPTDEYFKQLEPTEDLKKRPEEFLSDLIRPVMVKKFGQLKTVEILASLNAVTEEQIAMRGVLATLYDSNGALYLIEKDKFDVLTASSQTLKEFIATGKMQSQLATAFSRPGLSDLALMIYRSSRGSEADAKTTRDKLANALKQMVKATKAHVSDDEYEKLSAIVFDCLNDVGMILTGLNF